MNRQYQKCCVQSILRTLRENDFTMTLFKVALASCSLREST